ncbi:MAG: hypothetical protein L6420_08235 [Elusimicrobia bacterium]|nr:hypothetical protein [Elusimicrobiota bacterium]
MKKTIIFAVAVTLSGAAFASGFEDFRASSLPALDTEIVNNVDVTMPTVAKKIDIDNAATEGSFNKLKSETGIQGSTPYDVLKKLFEAGTPATEKDLTGWYSGRSIDSRYPKEFMASLFVGRLAPLHQNGGPLFSKEEVFLVNAYAWHRGMMDSVPPDYFDNQTWDRNEELIDYGNGAETVHLVDHIEGFFGQPDCTFAITFPEAEGIIEDDGKTTLQYRKANGYIIERFLNSDATGKILTESYSYYFKNVTPKD